ncbi:MAG: hypothetical protein SFU87_00100 [Chitinophagaceae bacterium]|nr:hypothetical protein [Chitinophagaceae bacterium]
MDKNITTLVVLFVAYLVVAVAMTLFAPAQKFFTMFFFGLTGIALYLGLFLLWLFNRKD